MKKVFTIVLPIYGNQDNLPVTIPYIIDHLELFHEYTVEILLVNDGSPDNSWELMQEYQNKYPELIRIVQLTRNFGQLSAWRCGMDLAKGDVIGFISADLQDPFELFSEMLKEWEKGYPIVIGARSERNEKGLSVLFSKLFQKLVHVFIDERYPKGGFDFFLIDKKVKEKYQALHESNDLTQLWLLWLGYEVKEIPYSRIGREVGKSGYTFFMKVEMGVKIFTVYSKFMINCLLSMGVFFFLCAVGICFASIVLIYTGVVVPDFLQSFGIGSFFTSINLIAFSVIGNYLWNTMSYCKRNPPYLIDRVVEKNVADNNTSK